MMMNLFSQFDPMCSVNSMESLILWSVMLFMDFTIVFSGYWLVKSNLEVGFFKFMDSLIKELYMIMSKKSIRQVSLMMILFTSILSHNIINLMPYNLSISYHISVIFSLTLWLLFSMNLMSWILKPAKVFTELVPIGTPLSLILLMVIIETISDMIRPLTLAVRLCANMTAGHLILSIASDMVIYLTSGFICSYVVYLLLLTLEVAVAIVQSYVFCLLLILYYSK
uniref:ATP synthase subunit a n=1 Tax=Sacculina sp. 'Beibu Gulf' TaxID=2861897 RepID=A0A8F9R8L9_9CRUS|nr:ATP synthase F0 subunit 6 [Sacculina sp. 'Beibu Gulf']